MNADGSNVLNSFGKDYMQAAMIAAGGLSGGISSTIAGGNFWDGLRQGIITSALNHVAHLAAGCDKPKPRKITIKDAAEHYSDGTGTPLTAELSSIDFSRVHMSEMDKNGNIFVKLDNPLAHLVDNDDALVYGSMVLQHVKGNVFEAAWVKDVNMDGSGDYYDFDIKWSNLKAWILGRNVFTMFGAFFNGCKLIGNEYSEYGFYYSGKAFPIYLTGTVTIQN